MHWLAFQKQPASRGEPYIRIQGLSCGSNWGNKSDRATARNVGGKRDARASPSSSRQPSGASRREGIHVLNPFNLTHQKATHFQHLSIWSNRNNPQPADFASTKCTRALDAPSLVISFVWFFTASLLENTHRFLDTCKLFSSMFTLCRCNIVGLL